ncbi:MAG: hypothetical protein RIE73_22575 [Coleofasciculus sp. C1-SOL-03]
MDNHTVFCAIACVRFAPTRYSAIDAVDPSLRHTPIYSAIVTESLF